MKRREQTALFKRFLERPIQTLDVEVSVTSKVWSNSEEVHKVRWRVNDNTGDMELDSVAKGLRRALGITNKAAATDKTTIFFAAKL